MFTEGQFVQSLKGGPKLKVVEVNGDKVICVLASDEHGPRITHRAQDIALYREEGDFGVC